ncbi:MAG: hypothetical protein DRJ52_06740 [Thermoprotei archaeon]|nr:MAG: hypothetical protein DRJ52_06740 [Thermoprotei archaeon]RLF00073.1 MAG: hypothetical protein DRJ63_03525 [Thermoprotei archaeon]HDI75368.1 hypothetical protein [Thermoprotei archaeon]
MLKGDIKIKIIGGENLTEEKKGLIIAAVLAYLDAISKEKSQREERREIKGSESYWNYSKFLLNTAAL